jgi:hypothetical protein
MFGQPVSVMLPGVCESDDLVDNEFGYGVIDFTLE